MISAIRLMACFALVTVAAPAAAQAARYYYYMAGERNYFEPAQFHAAVLTPSDTEAWRLSQVLAKEFGTSVQSLAVPEQHLTLVEIPEASYVRPLAAALKAGGFVTYVAFSGHFKDGPGGVAPP